VRTKVADQSRMWDAVGSEVGTNDSPIIGRCGGVPHCRTRCRAAVASVMYAPHRRPELQPSRPESPVVLNSDDLHPIPSRMSDAHRWEIGSLVSRELVYTALTRASRHCTLLIEQDVTSRDVGAPFWRPKTAEWVRRPNPFHTNRLPIECRLPTTTDGTMPIVRADTRPT